jgi:hypothetical protein
MVRCLAIPLAEWAGLEVVLIKSDVAVAVARLAKGYAFARWARRVILRWVTRPSVCYVSCVSLVRLGNLVAVRCSFQGARVSCKCNKFVGVVVRHVIR